MTTNYRISGSFPSLTMEIILWKNDFYVDRYLGSLLEFIIKDLLTPHIIR